MTNSTFKSPPLWYTARCYSILYEPGEKPVQTYHDLEAVTEEETREKIRKFLDACPPKEGRGCYALTKHERITEGGETQHTGLPL